MKTIRSKIAVLFLVCLVFIGVLHVFYYKNLFDLEEKLITIQNFDDFRNNILELRRYEKNFIYFKDLENLNESIYYLFKSEDFLNSLSEDIKRVIGTHDYKEFSADLSAYKTILGKNMALIKADKNAVAIDVEHIRIKGKKLVDFTEKLIATKRQRIQKAIYLTMATPLTFLASFIVLVIVIFRFMAKGILAPLALLQRATEEAAKGTFVPISYTAEKKDEVVQLIDAFNEMAKKLELKQEQLLQSRKMVSIGTFTSGIAHELNNPINNISLTAESLLDLLNDHTQAEAREMTDDILAQADRAGQIVKDLLEFSRTERPYLLSLSIKETLERTIKLIKNQVMVTGIQMKKYIPDNLPPIRGRRQDLQQAFVNILLNAIQAMQDISGENIITIRAGRGVEGYIRVDISDTGVGIKPEQVSNIFDPFFTTKEVGRGTGLGLSLVYGIVRTHGGYIEVKSEMNKGTTFSIFLPTATNTNSKDIQNSV